MAQRVLNHLPGKIGYNPGSQIVQIVGITALDKIDHFIKERLKVKYYIRYMDDFILIHRDKAFLERCRDEIIAKFRECKMEPNVSKTFIQPVSKEIEHLGFMYRLTKTGKVVILVRSDKVKRERKKIIRMVALVHKGRLTKHDVDVHFKAWKASIRYGNSRKLIEKLNKWYSELWEEQNGICINHKT